MDIQEIQSIIESIFHTKAEFFLDESVIKISFPRNDLNISVDHYHLHPFMGLTSWIAFQKGTKKDIEIMAMGDLALLEDEVNQAMSIALDNDIQITALHNHFFYDHPKIYFMHLEAEGSLQDVSHNIYKIFETIKQIKPKTKLPLPTTHNINGKPIEEILGLNGTAKEGMFKIVIGRQIQAGCGCSIGKNMGVNTWIAFGGTNDNAIIDGDFAILESELQPVLRSLRNAGIAIVAIHNHMIHENPRMMFLHFWGHGNAIDLSHGIKNALEQTSTLKSKSDKYKSSHTSCC